MIETTKAPISSGSDLEKRWRALTEGEAPSTGMSDSTPPERPRITNPNLMIDWTAQSKDETVFLQTSSGACFRVTVHLPPDSLATANKIKEALLPIFEEIAKHSKPGEQFQISRDDTQPQILKIQQPDTSKSNSLQQVIWQHPLFLELFSIPRPLNPHSPDIECDELERF